MFVRYAMTAGVIPVEHDERCRAVLEKLRQNGFRRAPVVDGSRLVGIVTERDLSRRVPTTVGRLERSIALDGEDPRVSEVMKPDPITIERDAHLEDAARAMLDHKIGGLPVVHDGALVGIITESDVFRSFVRIASGAGSVRIALLDRNPERSRPAGVEPATLCARLGLSLHTLLTHETPGGPLSTTLWVSGDRARELPRLLELAGYSILSIESVAHAG